MFNFNAGVMVFFYYFEGQGITHFDLLKVIRPSKELFDELIDLAPIIQSNNMKGEAGYLNKYLSLSLSLSLFAYAYYL